MLKPSIVVAALALLVGCQTALHQEYRAACPRIDVPFSCTIDMARPGCGPISKTVSECANFLDRAVAAEELRVAREKGLKSARYQNPAADKILIGMKDHSGSQLAIYVDPSNLESYMRSSELAWDLLESKVARYAAASKAYLQSATGGHTNDVKALEDAEADILKLRSPFEQAYAAGEPIRSFYRELPFTSYPITVSQISNRLDYRNAVLNNASRLAIKRHLKVSPRSLAETAHATANKFRFMTQEIIQTLPGQLAQDKARAEALVAGFERQKASEAAARSRQRQYHERYQAPAESGSSGGYNGGGCSCSSGNVCYGPRGGRFCITSGGNKRYGI